MSFIRSLQSFFEKHRHVLIGKEPGALVGKDPDALVGKSHRSQHSDAERHPGEAGQDRETEPKQQGARPER